MCSYIKFFAYCDCQQCLWSLSCSIFDSHIEQAPWEGVAAPTFMVVYALTCPDTKTILLRSLELTLMDAEQNSFVHTFISTWHMDHQAYVP